MNKLLVLLFLTLIFRFSFSQDRVFFDKIYQDSIKTVKLNPVNAIFSYPIITLNSDEKLLLSFDDLDSENQVFDYYYTFIHCNSDWTQSSLYFEDFCSGFEDNQIYDYENSFNTLKDFINYSVEFPNDDIDFLLSGNYIIIVYRDNNIEDTVLTKRFSVSEKSASIDANVRISTLSSFRETSHQVDFTVTSTEFKRINPLQYTSIYVYQNNRPDIVKQKTTPSSINGNTLKFENPFDNLFYAGNEFRFFDAKSIRFTSEKVQSIKLINFYNFYLLPEPEKEKYFFHKDINGNYIIQNDLGRDANTDADYVYVHFSMPRDYPYPNNDVYIFGEITNWQYLPEFKMNYDAENKVYEKSVFLKQGYYNYQYKLKNDNNIIHIDGNYFETKNDYVIYVYLRDPVMNYDRLIGTAVVGN